MSKSYSPLGFRRQSSNGDSASETSQKELDGRFQVLIVELEKSINALETTKARALEALAHFRKTEREQQ